MAEADDRAQELDYLGGKVYQAKELIGRLRESNRALNSRLGDIERRLQEAESTPLEREPSSGQEAASVDSGNRELAAEIERLRSQRREIRDRVSRLLERIEGLDL